jgi:hypothetical protein
MWHLDAEALGRLDDIETVLDRNFTAVDFEFWHVFLKTVMSNE